MRSGQSWLDYLKGRGELHHVGGNHSFSLSLDAPVLIVVKGGLDLFTLDLSGQGANGRRHELFRLEEGASAWPLSQELEVGLVAVPLPDSEILAVPKALLLEMLKGGAYVDVALQLFASWATAVTLNLGSDLDFDRPVGSLDAGLIAFEEGDVGFAQSMVWVRVLKGSCALKGRYVLRPGQGWLFVPPAAWLEIEEESELQVVDELTMASAEGPTGWVTQTLEMIRSFAAHSLHAHHERAQERLDARKGVDREQWQDALFKLGTTFEPERSVSGRLDESSDPLWRVMAQVAEAAGSSLALLTPPLEMERSERLRLIARASRLPLREVALKERWWRKDSGPLVAFKEESGEPVALLPMPAGGYRMVDASGQRSKRLGDALAASLYPMAWSFYRTFKAESVGVLDLWRFGLRDVKRELVTLLGVGALAGLVALATPIATGLIFSDVIPSGQRSQITVVALALGAASIALALFGLVQGFAMIRIDVRFGGAVQAAMWHRLLTLPVSFFRDYTAGDLATRAGAVDEIRETLSASTISVLVSSIFSSFNLALLFSYDPSLALLGVGLVLLALAVSVLAALAQLNRHREVALWDGKLAGLLMQLLSAVGKIRTAGAERRAFAQWSGLFSKQVRASVEASRVDNLLAVFGTGYPLVTMIAIFGMVGSSLGADAMDTGDFLAFNAAFSVFLSATLQLGSIGVAALEALPAWERAKPILSAIPESHDMKSDPGKLRGAIEFQRVSFRYTDEGPLILKAVNFEVKAGECVAIVGPSGSGKSTLLRLLLGFEVPTTGAVYFDGNDLERVDLYALRRQLGVVLQDGAIMSGDIYSNIAGANRVELDDAWEAARQAALDEEIRAMPMGMHTVMPEGGGTLSGGQRQRLLIARALVRKPRILLLDEATSALDNQSQARVTQSVGDLKATRIIIAHRLTTIRHVDRILVLKDGVLVEQGTFDELMAIPEGVFSALARRQMVEEV